MARIYNSDLTKGMAANAGLQQNYDKIPNELAEKVVPVMEVNPKLLRTIDIAKAGTATNATSATIYTTNTLADTYISAAFLGVIKDATSTSTRTDLQVYINGLLVPLLSIPNLTLTAQTENTTISFPIPIKIDRGTNVLVANTTNVANVTARGGIFGFEVSNPNV